MFDKIEELERRYQELEALLSDPAVIAQPAGVPQALPRAFGSYRSGDSLPPLPETLTEIEGNRELLADPDMKEMAEEELRTLEEDKERLEAEIRLSPAEGS